MKRGIGFCLFFLCTFLVCAASIWEGSAIAGGAGEFPNDGYYGACNAFPRNSKVEIENLENGKKIYVTISKNVENPGVFIALSPNAAAELGMKAGNAARVRVIADPTSLATAPVVSVRPGESSDPDFNPKIFALRERPSDVVSQPVAAPISPVASPDSSIPSSPSDIALLLKPEESTSPAATPSEPNMSENLLASSDYVKVPTRREEPLALTESYDIAMHLVASKNVDEISVLQEPNVKNADTEVSAPEAMVAIETPTKTSVIPHLDEPEILPDELPDEMLVRASPPQIVAADEALAEVEISYPSSQTEEIADASAPSIAPRRVAELSQEFLALSDEPLAAEEPIAAEEPVIPEEVAMQDGLLVAVEPIDAEEAIIAEKPIVDAVSLRNAGSGISDEVAITEEPVITQEDLVAEEPITTVEPTMSEEPIITEEPILAEELPQAEEPLIANNAPQAIPAETAIEPGVSSEVPEYILSLEPANARPPNSSSGIPTAALDEGSVMPPATEAQATVSIPSTPSQEKASLFPSSISKLEKLAKDSYYVQIGVYGSSATLSAVAGNFADGYPLAVEDISIEASQRYRLYIGPLSRDESGLVLTRIKAMGFKDAFLKRGG